MVIIVQKIPHVYVFTCPLHACFLLQFLKTNNYLFCEAFTVWFIGPMLGKLTVDQNPVVIHVVPHN